MQADPDAQDTGQAVLLLVDGRPLMVDTSMNVLAALMAAGRLCARRSVSGEPRFGLCGIGYCQECRVTIDGQAHRLACQARCRDGMVIVTDGASQN
jgi:D-hydroxyproline dehydrogenase subunit gamma